MSIEIMSHEQANRSHAAERYVLCELTAEEREAFEGHYFDCPACFERVKLEMEFLRQARQVLDPEPEKGWLARMLGDLRRPVPAFASAMLLCAIGVGTYQQVEIAGLRGPWVETNYVVHGASRGTENTFRVSRKSKVSLSVLLESESAFPSYRAQILTESKKVKYPFFPVTVTDSSTTIGFAAGDLDAGRFRIEIQGVPQAGEPVEVFSGAFDLEFTD